MEFKLPERFNESNKGTYGKVLNIAGSKYMRGAAYLSSAAALTIGCGYLVLCSDEAVLDTVSVLLPEAVLSPITNLEKDIKEADVISLGCGLSTDNLAINIFNRVMKISPNIPVIIDADGLNILAQTKVKKLPEELILTPHPIEAARLLHTTPDTVLGDTKRSAAMITEKYNCTTVLKSHNTVVCSKNLELYEHKAGNSALAKAGSGDVLCGIIAGLLAQKMTPFDATTLGVYLHGLSGRVASKNLTEYSVLASELITHIPAALKLFLKS